MTDNNNWNHKLKPNKEVEIKSSVWQASVQSL